MKINMLKYYLLSALLFINCLGFSQKSTRDPIIDVHLHAMPVGFGLSIEKLIDEHPGSYYQPAVFDSLRSELTDKDVLTKTLQHLKTYNVVRAITSGPLLNQYVQADSQRIIPAFFLIDLKTSVDSLRKWFVSGRYKVLGEVATQYIGLSPADPVLDPFYSLAEELNIPVGIHMGPGAPGNKNFKIKNGNPLLIEDVLLKHPNLKLWIMHAGYPMENELISMLSTYGNLYIDISALPWSESKTEFYRFLKRLVDAGFANRIMFGSDQNNWPELIAISIRNIENAPFMTKKQKRDIFYNNAARFFQIKSL